MPWAKPDFSVKKLRGSDMRWGARPYQSQPKMTNYKDCYMRGSGRNPAHAPLTDLCLRMVSFLHGEVAHEKALPMLTSLYTFGHQSL